MGQARAEVESLRGKVKGLQSANRDWERSAERLSRELADANKRVVELSQEVAGLRRERDDAAVAAEEAKVHYEEMGR